jgi:hypothetical protein
VLAKQDRHGFHNPIYRLVWCRRADSGVLSIGFGTSFRRASDASFHVEYRSPVCAAETMATVRRLRNLILNNFRRANQRHRPATFV